MWPWGHFGVAYLLYALYSRERFDRPPRPEPAMAVIVGSQFADLIDKPLGWLGVFPHGRFLAHSLLFTAVLIVGVYVAAFAANRVETATAFVIAHLSHLLADVPPRVLLGYPFGTEFLFWPFLSHPTFGFNERVFEAPTVLELIVTPFTNPFVFFALDVSLFGAGITLWYLHGCPGLQRVRSWIRRDRAVHPVE
jgi:hypothetical protein